MMCCHPADMWSCESHVLLIWVSGSGDEMSKFRLSAGGSMWNSISKLWTSINGRISLLMMNYCHDVLTLCGKAIIRTLCGYRVGVLIRGRDVKNMMVLKELGVISFLPALSISDIDECHFWRCLFVGMLLSCEHSIRQTRSGFGPYERPRWCDVKNIMAQKGGCLTSSVVARNIDNSFNSLHHQRSISHSISNIEITLKLNWTVFGFDDVLIIGVARNTGISHLNQISFTQSSDLDISFNFNHRNHSKIELNCFRFWWCIYNRCG